MAPPNSNDVEPPIFLESNNPKPEIQNKAIVGALYKALALGEIETVAKLLASDLEWWFHGPPQRHHMMRALTGESDYNEFTFEPRSITVIGDDSVVVEGWEGAQAYWVHLWTLKDGLIIQFREYFNTWLTVRDLRPWEIGHECGTLVWQSQPRDLYKRSLPGLMIAM
jgi:ketosteroid isomerase-like protein|uniref:Wound-induced protein 1 n=1 Tax=Fagus sylvatica TaxID=28930 RepID=A0A2N9IVK1_FAGSY